MILPNKHITVSESLLGFGAILLNHIRSSIHVDDLWVKFESLDQDTGFAAPQSFDNFILTLDLLFMIGLIELESDGKVRRATR